MNLSINNYWQNFLHSRPDLSHLKNDPPDAWAFGGNADLLLSLVLEGKKTATASLLSVYKDGSVPLPIPGSYSIILSSSGDPKCVIHLIETKIKKFNEIDAEHAFAEGEGTEAWITGGRSIWSFFRPILTLMKILNFSARNLQLFFSSTLFKELYHRI